MGNKQNEATNSSLLQHMDGVPFEVKELGYLRLMFGILSIFYGVMGGLYLLIWTLVIAVGTMGIGLILLVFMFFPLLWIVMGIISCVNGHKLTGEDRSKHRFPASLAVLEILSILTFCPLAVVGILSFYMRRNSNVDDYLRAVDAGEIT